MKIEFDATMINSTIELTHLASFGLIVRFALEIARFVCDRATTIENEKLRSKGIAYSISVYYA